MPGRINSLILKVAELCNLNCSYCYLYQHADKSYLHRPKFMSEIVFDQVLIRTKAYCDQHAPHQIDLIMHGGEPMLIGPRRLGQFAKRARELLEGRLKDIGMQTNATLINDEWLEVIHRYDIHVGVSLDGPAEIHDAVRVDHTGRGSHAATVRGLQLLQEAGLSPSVLCVINPGACGLGVYRYFRSLGVRKFDFLLPDVSHDNKERLYGQYGATPISDYLIPIFHEWFEEDDPQIHIRLFWGLTSAVMGGSPKTDQFGNPRVNYLIIETDGSIHALDVLRVCEDGVTDSGLNVSYHGFDDLRLGLPLLHRMVHEGIPLAGVCQTCPEVNICGGGYLPHRYARSNGFDNPSVWCADILKLLSYIRNRVHNAISS